MQLALRNVPAGTVDMLVEVDPGEYWITAADPTDNRTAFRPVSMLNLIVRKSAAPGEAVIRRACQIDSQSFRFFRVVEGGSLVLESLTLTNGRAQDGGAIQAVRSNSVRLLNCRFVLNVASRGGAVSASQLQGDGRTNLLEITNCEFLCNASSAVGGAVDADRTRLDILGGVFAGNTVTSDIATEGLGGAIHFIKGSTVEENILLQIRPDPTLQRRPFFYNNTAADGGAMYIDGGLSIQNAEFPGDAPLPDGVQPIEADFANNRAARRGGAAFLVSSNLRFDRTRFGMTSAELSLALAQWPRINECQVPLAAGNCGGSPAVCSPANPPGPTPDAALGGGNRAGLQGGGVYNNRSTSYFRRCFFESNQALSERLFNCDKLSNGGDFGGSGGGLYIRGGSSAARITATECCFTNNRTGSTGSSGGGGGVCCVEGSVPVFDDCVIRGNRAARGGGMAFACLSDGILYNTVINNNIGTVAGGGLYLQSFSRPGSGITEPSQRFLAYNPKIVHCTITDNRATTSTGLRGVVGSTAGSGIHIQNNDGVPMVLNTIVWGNQSDLTGGGVDALFGTSFSFGYIPTRPNVATPNLAPDGSQGFPQVIFSDIDTGNNQNFPVPAGLPAGSNFDANPRFVNVAQGNVHLTCPSPCIDRASNQYNLAFLSSVARQAGLPLRFFVTNVPPADLEDEVSQIITNLQDDYDDGSVATNVIPPASLTVPDINEVCPAPNCTTPYQFGEPIQPRTCRATQCQSDIGADESRTTFNVTSHVDRVVCLGGQQSFTVSANCPDSSLCDTPLTPPVVGPTFLFGWCRLDPGPNNTCIETVIYDPFQPVSGTNPAPGYTVSPTGSGTSSTLTILSAQPRDNTVFKAKIYRGGPGLQVPLSTTLTVPIPPFSAPVSPGMFTGIECNPLLGCPPGMSQARLFVINPPTVTAVPPNPDIVCRNGNQCLDWDVTWSVLPGDPVTLCGYTSIPPTACIPTITFGKRTTPGGTDVPISPTDPRIQSDPPVIANGVATQRWRLCVANATDADCGRYTLTVACNNLGAGKCTPASASADLCVTPPPTATNGGNRTVCVGGQQTLTFTATYPASTCVFCPTTPCANSAIVTKNGVPLPLASYTCTPINASRQVTCTVNITSAQLTDCGEYCIEASCSNLPIGKCAVARSCANLCVLPLPTVTSDSDKAVCTGGNQTLNFSASFPVGTCPSCTAGSCTPSVVIKKDNVNLPAGSFVCDPITAQRVINCRVNITNAAAGNCGEYCIEATCSNLTGGKCGTARACTRLCVLPPIVVNAGPNASVCEGGAQTLTFTASFPIGTCPTCVGASCAPAIGITKNGVALPAGGFVCDPITAERSITCRVLVASATQADCGEYCIEATCGNLGPGKCGISRACTRLCVLPAPVVGGDSDATVCLGGDQTMNFFATFPVGPCANCTASNCTPSVVLKKNGVALPSNRYTCDPINAQRRINCRIRFNPTVADDQAEYCIEATCSNLTGGKCGTSRYCAKLCIVNPTVTTSDQAVCVGGSQAIEFVASYALLDPSFCPNAICTPSISITKNG
ncbi:MAG: hypothetical protein ACK4WH_11390, partial [Phycisphaerales bacterium]